MNKYVSPVAEKIRFLATSVIMASAETTEDDAPPVQPDIEIDGGLGT